jgi:hypothetical protein
MSVTFSGSDHRRTSPSTGYAASVRLDIEDARSVNWCNGNAVILLELLGLGHGLSEVDLYGEAAVPDVRRAILRARATLERRGPALARPATVGYGAPRRSEDGTVELRPVTRWTAGLDVEGMRVRLDALERCVDALVDEGATHVRWG